MAASHEWLFSCRVAWRYVKLDRDDFALHSQRCMLYLAAPAKIDDAITFAVLPVISSPSYVGSIQSQRQHNEQRNPWKSRPQRIPRPSCRVPTSHFYAITDGLARHPSTPKPFKYRLGRSRREAAAVICGLVHPPMHRKKGKKDSCKPSSNLQHV